MAEDRQQLVEKIAELVIAELTRQGLLGGDGASGGGRNRADVRPPIGVCTGDYSKFEELKGKGIGAVGEGGEGPDPGGRSRPVESGAKDVEGDGLGLDEPVELSGIVAVRGLEDAIGASPGGVAVLASDARLTPLAADYVREHPERVRRAGLGGEARGVSRGEAKEWGWWIDGQCPAVGKLTRQDPSRLRMIGANRSPEALGEVVRRVGDLVETNRIAGAVLFVQSAARAMCMANRRESLRAVLGTGLGAVSAAMLELRPNVLVVDYRRTNGESMQSMVAKLMSESTRPSRAILRQLSDITRVGG